MSGSQDIRMELNIPDTRLRVGVFQFDPVAQLLGQPLDEILDLLLERGTTEVEVGGRRHLRYCIRLAESEGLGLQVTSFGHVALRNESGSLVLEAPWPGVRWLADGLLTRLGIRDGVSLRASSSLGFAVLRFTPNIGERLEFPLGRFGSACVRFMPEDAWRRGEEEPR